MSWPSSPIETAAIDAHSSVSISWYTNAPNWLYTYRIDLYFPKHKIAVECDEFGHKYRDPQYEMERENYIKEELECVFIRFNPDDPVFNIFVVINKLIRLIYLNEDILIYETSNLYLSSN